MAIKPWLDQAGKFQVEHVGGIPHQNQGVDLGSPRTGVLHTTEGGWAGSMAVFKQHYAPHFLLGFDASLNKVRIGQLVQIGTIGAALVTHNVKAIVQIEMIGYSKENAWLPDDETLDALTSLMAVCLHEYGIPLTHPWKDGDYGKAGSNPHRSSGKFGTVAGWYGHADCPLPDSHWDPGNLKWSAVLKEAQHKAGTIDSGPHGIVAGPLAMAALRPQAAEADAGNDDEDDDNGADDDNDAKIKKAPAKAKAAAASKKNA